MEEIFLEKTKEDAFTHKNEHQIENISPNILNLFYNLLHKLIIFYIIFYVIKKGILRASQYAIQIFTCKNI